MLKDIINNFTKKELYRKLNYDSLKEIKILELQVCDTLRYVLPQDYVNWVRISLYKNGTLLPLTENIQTNWSDAYLQDNNCRILFDHDGNILKPSTSTLDLQRITGGKKSIYLNEQSSYNGQEGYFYNGAWYFEYAVGGRYGLNTETANANPNESLYKKYMTKGADYNPQKASLFAETIFTPMARPAMRQKLLDQQYSKKDYAGFIDNPSGFDFSIFQQ